MSDVPHTDTAQKPPERRKTFRSRVWLCACLLVLLLTAGAYYLWWPRSLPPPSLVLDGLDPDVAGALQAARAKVVARPRSSATWGRLGMALVANDLHDEALLCLRQAEQLDERDARWPYYQGLILVLRDAPAALAALQRAVRSNPDDVALRLRLAEALLAENRLEEAETRFREVHAMHPDNPRAHLGLGQIAARRGRWQDGVASLQRATPSPYARKAAHVALAEVYRGLNDATAAETQRRLASELPEDSPWPDPLVNDVDELRVSVMARIDRAERLMRQEQLDAAIDLLQNVIRDRPEVDEAHLKLAQAYIRQGSIDAAEGSLRQALRLRADSPDAHFLLGMVSQLRRLPRDAEAELRRTIELRPGHALAHYNLGQILRQQTKHAEAREAFRAAIRHRPNLVEAHVALAESLIEQGENAEARERLNDALRLAPEHKAAQNLLAKIPSK